MSDAVGGPPQWVEWLGMLTSVVLSGALGLTWWLVSVLLDRAQVDGGHDMLLPVYFALTAASVVAAASVRRRRRPFSLPMGAVPVVAASSTAPVGDADGLWLVQLPVLVVWLFVLLVLERSARLMFRPPRRHPADALPEAASRLVQGRSLRLVVVVILVATAGGLYARVAAGPWDAMAAELGSYPAPPGSERVALEREGSERCQSSCTPRLTSVLTFDRAGAQACTALEESLRAWPRVVSVRSEPLLQDGEECFYVAALRRGGVVPEVQAVVGATPSGAEEVRLTALVRCALTC